MNDMRNRLMQWLQTYDQSGMKPFSTGTMNGSQVYAPGAAEAGRMQWAQQMLDRESQQAPDYFNFGEEQAQAAPDNRVSPIRGPLNLPQSQGLQRNRLMAMMGGSYGR